MTDEEDVVSSEVSDRDFSGEELDGFDFSNHDFSGISCHDATLTNTNLEGTDFSNCNAALTDFSGAKCQGASFSGSDLSDASFLGADLRGVNFSDANIRGCDFRKADLRNVIFSPEQVREVDLRGAELTGADFSGSTVMHCNLENTSLRGILVDKNTRFFDCAIEGTEFPQYVLSDLGAEQGGLSERDLNKSRIVDDVVTLQLEYFGAKGKGHLLSVLVFAMPYIWFGFRMWLKASDASPIPGEESVSILEAFGRYVFSGGRHWREGWEWHWSAMLFFVILTYNIFRLVLVWKTNQLVTDQLVRGRPARFDLNAEWELAYKISSNGFWIYAMIVVVNVINFMLLRVPTGQ